MKIKIKNYFNFTPKFALGQIVNYKSEYNSFQDLRILAIIYSYEENSYKALLPLAEEYLNADESEALKTFIKIFLPNSIETVSSIQFIQKTPKAFGYVTMFPDDAGEACWDHEKNFLYKP